MKADAVVQAPFPAGRAHSDETARSRERNSGPASLFTESLQVAYDFHAAAAAVWLHVTEREANRR